PDDHDQALGVELARRREDVPDHAATAQLVQHLGRPAGLHPGPLARCEDDHGGGACHRSDHLMPIVFVSWPPLPLTGGDSSASLTKVTAGAAGPRAVTRPTPAGYRTSGAPASGLEPEIKGPKPFV